MERDWVIFVYGDQHQHVINHKLVRAFSKLFFEKSSAFVVLRLSPDPSFCFTKNKSMALEEARELLEEQQPGSLLLLMVFINDSSERSVSMDFCESFGEQAFILHLKGDEFVVASQDSSYAAVLRWLREMAHCIGEYENRTDEHPASTQRSREHEVMEEDETESDTLLGFDKLMRILDEVDRLKKPLAEVDMLTDIDVTPVHNRLSKPWPSRQWNGKLLRLVCAAVSTKLPDLQQSVAAFIDGLFTVEFPQQVFFNGICPAVRSSSFWDWDMVYSLCDLLQLLQIAIPFNPHGLAILVENVEWFMERLPDRFWMEAPEEARNEINALAKSFHESISRQRVSVEEEYRPAWEVCDEMEPPGDFRMLPVQLMRNDIIRPVRPYIRRNKDSGGFNDMEEYLDIQFRLLREDFVCPMRDGIAVWKQHACDDTFLLQFRDAYEQLDLLIIEGVRIEGVQLKRSSGEILRYAKFQPTADVLDRSSKKLKFGQMIALSSDNFKEEALFATIVERPDDQLLEGRIGLSFTAESESHVSKAKIYTIVESNAYFEMYQHVFEVIKHFNSDMPVPFARYLVNAETNVKLPAYLERPLPTDTTVDSEHVNGPTELSVMGTKYPIKRLMYTLDGDKLGIDGYQRNALISALTSELAIVQGPPGTGKTFIGRLIVRVLFENMNLWNPARAYPVLVVCYTNHALDQFLEGLLNDFEEAGVSNDYPSIVRLGSRCKNERLKRCMKANVMEDYAGIIDEISRTEMNKVMSERAKIIKNIGTRSAILAESKRNIISYEWLSKVISAMHKKQFNEMRRTPKGKQNPEEAFSEWLTMGPSADEERSARRELPIDDDITKDEYIVKSLSQTQLLDGVRRELEEGKMQWDVEESIPIVNHSFSKTNGGTRGEGDVAADEMAEQMTWKQIEETLLQSEVDNGDYYHMGLWDLDENERASRAASVTIFPPRPVHGQSSQKVRYDPGIVARLNARKEDILKVVALSAPEAESIKDIGTLHRDRRWMLYAFWIEQLKQLVEKELASLILKYQKHMVVVKAAFEKLDEIVLRRALVIGATTTGAAKSRSLLRRLGCRVVIVEEAAEVLEAHVLASIPDQCEHAILIGDHQQLKPNPAVHLLAKEYKLEISMFERLIKNNFPHSSLVYQHRMAPCISAPLMPHFYPSLEDAENVKVYPRVKGCVNSIFFMSHREPETATVSSSHCNEFEGDFAVELASYLCKQGYLCDQITVLCTYSAQTAYVRALVQTRFGPLDGPRVDTVDNYQGEENDIVILCLVRSCPSATIGFLAESNRICVALSRAKIGFYMIGNIDFLAYRSHLWSKIGRSLQENNCLGETFSIICTIHGTVQAVSNAKEFKLKSPNGGCGLACGVQLNCGHLCQRSCHADDREHVNACTERCSRVCASSFAHRCVKLCGEPCGQCCVTEMKVFPCGHSVEVVCHSYAKQQCTSNCEKVLPCGHQCAGRCGEPCSLRCLQLTERQLACGHRAQMKCCEDVKTYRCRMKVSKKLCARNHWMLVECSSNDVLCDVPCGKPLPCGHSCQIPCHEYDQTCVCNSKCSAQCGKMLKCGHRCERICGEECEPCTAFCSRECQHMCCGGSPADRDFSRRKCSEECLFCVQICANKCVHRACSYLCWQPCEVKPCKHKCTKKLRCGHSCAGLCGEMCPDLCNICDAARWKELFRNSGHSSSILQFQSCGCFLLVENVDAAIAMQQRSKEFLKCPKCLSKLTVKSCFRYAAQLKREALGVEKGKFLAAAVDLDRCSKAKANIIRWLATEVKDLKKCLNMTSPAKRGLLLLLTDAVDSIRIGMAKSNFNEVTASSWKRLLPDLSDLCAISRRIATTKFCSNPSRHLPCLRSIFTQYFGKSQNVHSAIDGQLSLLTGFMRQTIMEVPSTLIPSIACGVRVIFVKYQVSVMVREISKRATDLTKTQMNEIKMVIDKALTPAEESQQKKAVAELMRKFREIYDAFDMTHMLWAELQCITDPMLADPMLGT